MNVKPELLKPLDEARYLTADNASRYRVIMRYFYEQHQRLRYFLYKEDVFNYLKKVEAFFDYTMEKCEQDLNTLVQWKNLIATQDTGKAATLEEFRNKKFRYQLTPYSIELERVAIKLESMVGYGGSLEPSLFARVFTSITKITEVAKSEDQAYISRWWQELNGYFESIYHNATDYIAGLHSARADELMRTEAFLIYKDKMVKYLRDFIKDLQHFCPAIEDFLRNLEKSDLSSALDRVVEYELSIPRLDVIPSRDEIRESVLNRWENIAGWFLGYGGGESEAQRLLNVTNEIIRRITRYAARIAESQSRAASRKNDYMKLALMFAKCPDLREAHRLSAVVFGCFNTRHLVGDFERATDSITSSVWEERPGFIVIKPKTRSYGDGTARSPIRDTSAERLKILNEHLKDQERERDVIRSYIKNGRIDLRELPEVAPFVRTTLLRWIGKAMGTKGNTGRTEDGIAYRVLFPENGERIWMRSVDGNIYMPAFIIEFESAG
ncbi:TIGR02677 family protein [Thermosediminibacter litoriperuensis]|uniref:Uncharacterized protein (TIGR02677 family) n=1 Tax=Thermosediminibacter litoriperuensis TaxID=291989 RepID=A0A5S5AWY6_9FIRM|nr:TIGR02677 family protein [Thermosediminibacter litoriperuensis]TYP57869.1 uncharacterized protein (TIGR02677 family) [Thermosediminibacter litoriperuensis]